MLAQADTQDTHVEKEFWELNEELEQIRERSYTNEHRYAPDIKILTMKNLHENFSN